MFLLSAIFWYSRISVTKMIPMIEILNPASHLAAASSLREFQCRLHMKGVLILPSVRLRPHGWRRIATLRPDYIPIDSFTSPHANEDDMEKN